MITIFKEGGLEMLKDLEEEREKLRVEYNIALEKFKKVQEELLKVNLLIEKELLEKEFKNDFQRKRG